MKGVPLETQFASPCTAITVSDNEWFIPNHVDKHLTSLLIFLATTALNIRYLVSVVTLPVKLAFCMGKLKPFFLTKMFIYLIKIFSKLLTYLWIIAIKGQFLALLL